MDEPVGVLIAADGEDRVRQLARAVEQSPALIVITTVGGEIEYVNPSFEQATGYASAEALGRNPRLVQSGLTPPSVYAALWSTIAQGRTWRGELQNRRKDGSLYWERISISGVRDASGRITHYVKVGEDVTEGRRALAALRLAEQHLLQVQKMEAISRLAGGIAHDFNNLLSVILGHGEQIAASPGGSGRDAARAQQIVWTTAKAASITRQLLAFSQQQVLEPRVVRLDAVVDGARDRLQRVIGAHVTLDVANPPALGCVQADPGQLVQVLLNLAVNARDAMPRGGRLTVEFQDVELDEDYVASHPPCRPGPYVMLAVTDTGHGMAPEIQHRIFEPFFTTRPEGVGTGLGLSTVYGVVKQSGGFIWVYSERGIGTCFKIYLPRVDAAAEPPLPAADDAHEPARPRGRSRVLLVEDDDSVRDLMADILEAEGHFVIASPLPADALQLAARHEPFDLLITDVIMPGMSGRDLAHLLVERSRVARVLFVSGYAGEALAAHGGIDRGELFLQKPFNRRSLVALVRQALAEPEGNPGR